MKFFPLFTSRLLLVFFTLCTQRLLCKTNHSALTYEMVSNDTNHGESISDNHHYPAISLHNSVNKTQESLERPLYTHTHHEEYELVSGNTSSSSKTHISPKLDLSQPLNPISITADAHLKQLSNYSTSSVNTTSKRSQLLVISFDGFRYDYNRMFRRQMANFERLSKRGVWAPMGIQTAFVTKTFPTHFSIVTGLYEESHGIIDNNFFDPVMNNTFTRSSLKSEFFQGEPIWATGSDVPINGIRPTEWYKYNGSIPLSTRFETAIRWLDAGTELVMLYFHEPDSSGHSYGVGSVQMSQAIAGINTQLGRLLDQLRSRQNVNIIVLSDHGMVNVQMNRKVVLSQYLDLNNDVLLIPQYGNIAAILPAVGKKEIVLEKLSNVAGIKCYLREDLPEHFHYKHSNRVMPVVCIPDLGVYIVVNEGDPMDKLGSHGYDNMKPQMRPIFYAAGPDFKAHTKTAPFETVNLYSLFCHILDIKPASNNGTLENVKHLLSESSLNRLK